jgi:malonyl-CoA O-methyltransferase
MPQTVDKQLVRERFRRSLHAYDCHAEVQAVMADELLEELIRLKGRRYARMLEIGCGSGTLSRPVVEALEFDRFYANDLVAECRPLLEQQLGTRDEGAWEFLSGDIESDLELPGELDLIVSSAAFQWLENPHALLPRLHDRLSSGGVLAFATFGPGNLREIREITGIGLRYPGGAEWLNLLHDGFRLLHQREHTAVYRFESPLAVLRHLRSTGVNAVTVRRWQRRGLEQFAASYWQRWGDGASVPLTYQPLLFIAEKR